MDKTENVAPTLTATQESCDTNTSQSTPCVPQQESSIPSNGNDGNNQNRSSSVTDTQPPESLLEKAKKFHGMGANILPLGDKSNPAYDMKAPSLDTWIDLQNRRQESQELLEYNWSNPTGLAIVQGPEGYRCIDLDKVTVGSRVVEQIQEILGLPQNYPWSEQTGSGFHVHFRCFEELPSDFISNYNSKGLFKGESKDGSFLRAELRWNDCYTAVAPSDHPLGKKYEWLHGEPNEPAAVVSVDKVIEAFQAVAKITKPSIPVSSSKKNYGTWTMKDIANLTGIPLDIVMKIQKAFTGETVLDYARENFETDKGIVQTGNDYRFLENGGLIIRKTDQGAIWNCFLDEIGGGWLDLVGYHNNGSDWCMDDKEKVTKALYEAAKFVEIDIDKELLRYSSTSTAALTAIEDSEHFSDVGNAKRIVNKFGKNIRYCPPWKTFMIWNGKYWQKDDTNEVMRLAKETVRQMYLEASITQDPEKRKSLANFAVKSEYDYKLKCMLSQLESEPGIPILPSEFDKDPWIFNVQNGTIDLRTGKLLPHNREHLITKISPVVYDASATCPRWVKFVMEIMDNNVPKFRFLKKIAGYCMTGFTREQKMYLFYGPGANGKGVYCQSMENVFGDYAKPTNFTTFMGGANNAIRNDLACLVGARFVLSPELPQGQRLDEVVVKQVTGCDTITARFLNKEFFDFTPTFKVILQGNHKPTIVGTDQGIWRRIVLVPFLVTIPEEKRDKELFEKLKPEWSGILRWAVEGCLLWQQEGLEFPKEVTDATNEYRDESDVLADFIKDCCIVGSTKKVIIADLYKHYQTWSNLQHQEPVSKNEFSRRLKDRGIKSDRFNGARHYFGIDFNEERKSFMVLAS